MLEIVTTYWNSQPILYAYPAHWSRSSSSERMHFPGNRGRGSHYVMIRVHLSPPPCCQKKERCVYSSMLNTCMVMEVVASTLYIVRMHVVLCVLSLGMRVVEIIGYVYCVMYL